MIKIERLVRVNVGNDVVTVQRELLAEVPGRSDTYDTGKRGVGEISVTVCPPDYFRKVQKFVLVGKIMEKNCSKGGTTLRRVVKIPLSGKEVAQDISNTDSLIFSLNGNSLRREKGGR